MKLNFSLKTSSLNAALSLAFITTAIACAPNVNMGTVSPDQDNSAIIGGQLVPEGSPVQTSIVAIQNVREGYLCSGSLLPNNIVLTAAHCIGKNAKDHVIIFSTNANLTKDSDKSRLRLVSKVLAHKDWGHKTPEEIKKNPNAWNSDLGLLKFEGTVPAGFVPATFAPPATSAATDLLKPGTKVLVAGYGVDKDDIIEVPIENTLEFQQKVKSGEIFCGIDDKTKKQTCMREEPSGSGILKMTQLVVRGRMNPQEVVVMQNQGTAMCMGDSGGPAYIVAPGNKLYLFGVASRVSRGCNGMGIYTDATSQITWLNENIAMMLGVPVPRPQQPAPAQPLPQPQPIQPLPQQPVQPLPSQPQRPPVTAPPVPVPPVPVPPAPLPKGAGSEKPTLPPKAGQLAPGQQGPVAPAPAPKTKLGPRNPEQAQSPFGNPIHSANPFPQVKPAPQAKPALPTYAAPQLRAGPTYTAPPMYRAPVAVSPVITPPVTRSGPYYGPRGNFPQNPQQKPVTPTYHLPVGQPGPIRK